MTNGAFKSFVAMVIAVALALSSSLATPTSAAEPDFAKRAEQAAEAQDYPEALQRARQALAAAEAAEIAAGKKPGAQTASALGALAWYAMLADRPGEAVEFAARGFALAPEKLWIEANRAIALVLLGRIDEALRLHRANLTRPGEPNGAQSWQDMIEKDLATMLQRGIGRPRISAFVEATDGLVPLAVLRPQPPLKVEQDALAWSSKEGLQIRKLQAAGRTADALALFRSVAEKLEQTLGRDHHTVALWVRGVADYQYSLDPKVDVRPLYGRALAITEAVHGAWHPELIVPLQTLGLLDVQRGDVASARRRLERAVAIAEKRGPTQAKAFVETLGQLADIDATQKGASSGETRLRGALPRVVTLAGERSEAMALMQVKLGELLEAQGRKAEADALFEAALPILEEVRKPDHMLISQVLSSRSLYLQKKSSKHSSEKMTLARRMVKHLETAGESKDVARTAGYQEALWGARAMLGGHLLAAGEFVEAEAQMQTVLQFRESEKPPRPDAIARAHAALGLLFTNMSRWREALPPLERALALRETLPDPEDSNLAVTLGQLGLTYAALDRDAEAERMYRRQIDLLEREKERDGKSLAIAYSGLAGLLTKMERSQEAGQYHARAVSAIDAAPALDPGTLPLMLEGLAIWQRQVGRYAAAETTARRALAVREEESGRDAPETTQAITTLASVLNSAGRYADAEPLYRRSIAILETAPSHVRSIGNDAAHNNLAEVLAHLGRFEEARLLFLSTLDSRKQRLGEESSEYAIALGAYAGFLEVTGDERAGLATKERALAILEKAHGPNHRRVATALNNLSVSYMAQNRMADAERALRRALEINERAFGADGPATLTNLHNLAGHLSSLGRTGEAIEIYARVVADRERVLGSEHPHLAATLVQQSGALVIAERYEEAVSSAKRGLAIRTTLFGSEHFETAAAVGALANAYGQSGQKEAALHQYRGALDIRQKALRPDHPDTITTYNNIGQALMSLGRLDEAETALRKALALQEANDAQSSEATTIRDNLAFLALRRGEWLAAIAALDQSVKDQLASPRAGLTSTLEISLASHRGVYGSSIAVLQAAALALKDGLVLDQVQQRAVFDAMQRYAGGVAARRIEQAGRRWSSKDPRLATLVRERQDLGFRVAMLDRRMSAGLATARRDDAAMRAMRTEFAALLARQSAIETEIRVADPAYFDLVRQNPLTIGEVQALLRDNEVVVTVATVHRPEGYASADPGVGLVLAITRTQHRLVRLEASRIDIENGVGVLRCGLDASAWNDAVRFSANRASTCRELVGVKPPSDGALPFDLERAHRLYRSLFAGIGDLTENRHLLIVTTYPLADLPWHVLVRSAPPTRFALSTPMGSIDWLALANPITMLPSATSLRVLRQMARPSQATRTWIGFGNPLLDGPDARYAKAAELARRRQSCGGLGDGRIQSASLPRAVKAPAGQVDLRARILAQAPLPETADELCEVASALGAEQADVFIGSAASKAALQRLDREGRLASYGMLHFATHAAKPGELLPMSEPGLVLSPDAEARSDDGYLTATEIGELKLDADWVILSACNTASSGGDGDALSGLAQAFFFAGARALLVSHWYVDSIATERLVKATLKAVAENRSVGRAVALQAGMRAIMTNGEPHMAHPSIWAPFVVVGEGAAGL